MEEVTSGNMKCAKIKTCQDLLFKCQIQNLSCSIYTSEATLIFTMYLIVKKRRLDSTKFTNNNEKIDFPVSPPYWQIYRRCFC